jgi:hypothetical protein
MGTAISLETQSVWKELPGLFPWAEVANVAQCGEKAAHCELRALYVTTDAAGQALYRVSVLREGASPSALPDAWKRPGSRRARRHAASAR